MKAATTGRSENKRSASSKIDLDRARELLAAGNSINATAQAVGCDPKTIRHHQTKGRLPLSIYRRPVATDIDLAKALELANAGMTLREIAVGLGIGLEAARTIVEKGTIALKGRRGRKPGQKGQKPDLIAAAEDIRAGKTIAEVAMRNNCSISAIRHHIKTGSLPSPIRRLGTVNIEAARTLLDMGLSIERAAQAIGVSGGAIIYRQKSGDLPPSASRDIVDINVIVEMKARGIAVAEIAKQFGVSRQAIYQRLKSRNAQ